MTRNALHDDSFVDKTPTFYNIIPISLWISLSVDEYLGYAIVRPGGLKDGKPVGAGSITLNQGDTIVGEINRSDVANIAIAAAVSNSIPQNVVFEVYESGGGGPLEGRFPGVSGFERDGRVLGGDYNVLLQGLKPGVDGI